MMMRRAVRASQRGVLGPRAARAAGAAGAGGRGRARAAGARARTPARAALRPARAAQLLAARLQALPVVGPRWAARAQARARAPVVPSLRLPLRTAVARRMAVHHTAAAVRARMVLALGTRARLRAQTRRAPTPQSPRSTPRKTTRPGPQRRPSSVRWRPPSTGPQAAAPRRLCPAPAATCTGPRLPTQAFWARPQEAGRTCRRAGWRWRAATATGTTRRMSSTRWGRTAPRGSWGAAGRCTRPRRTREPSCCAAAPGCWCDPAPAARVILL
mmetsp:Transcript_8907/g.22029  ORF Transcript_8907/g.22029 Transcript_8907/m.22029 type:complete len:272 (-) Transcript_8907:696-1511(-)